MTCSIRKICNHTSDYFPGVWWLHNIHFTSLSHPVKLIADITGLIQSSFCLPSSGQSASSLCTLNIIADLSFSLPSPLCNLPPPHRLLTHGIQPPFKPPSSSPSPVSRVRRSCPDPPLLASILL